MSTKGTKSLIYFGTLTYAHQMIYVALVKLLKTMIHLSKSKVVDMAGMDHLFPKETSFNATKWF